MKKIQEMKQIQKMNAEKIMTLTRDLNVNITLTTRKNTTKIQKFKEMMIFKMIFERSKKILKLNNF